jgi:formylglycine-generating enzyme required for sulfatase activity
VGQFRKFVEATQYVTEAEQSESGAWGITAAGSEKSKAYSWRNPGFEQTDDHPVVDVSWNDAMQFCEWLSTEDGVHTRLPTEAEWEYACRAGTTTPYWNGADQLALVTIANVLDRTAAETIAGTKEPIDASDGYAFTSPVGSFRANPFQLYDMHGNVSEKCLDAFDADLYTTEDRVDPVILDEGSRRVSRGGEFAGSVRMLRADYRHPQSPTSHSFASGFRVVQSVGNEDHGTTFSQR